MSSKNQKNQRKLARESKAPREDKKLEDLNQPWISTRSGIRIITVISIGLGIWVTYSLQSEAWGQRVLFGLIFGGSIWLIFLLALTFGRFFRNRSKK